MLVAYENKKECFLFQENAELCAVFFRAWSSVRRPLVSNLESPLTMILIIRYLGIEYPSCCSAARQNGVLGGRGGRGRGLGCLVVVDLLGCY